MEASFRGTDFFAVLESQGWSGSDREWISVLGGPVADRRYADTISPSSVPF